MSKRKILITGASGFIGANLVRRLMGSGDSLHLFLRPNSSNLWRLNGLPKKAKIYEVNLEHKEELKKIIFKIKPDIIFHLAAYGSYPFENDFERIFKVNVVSTVQLTRICMAIGFESFVNVGSSSEFGENSKAMREDNHLSPTTEYGSAKAAATIMLEQFARSTKLNIITIRPFSVYGPYELASRLIPTLMVGAIIGKPVSLASKKSVRDFIFINDLIDALILASRRTGISGVLNIGSGKEHSVFEVVQVVSKISKGKLKVKWDTQDPRSYEMKHWIADNTKARKTLGWRQHYSLEQGLTETYDWFTKNLSLYK